MTSAATAPKHRELFRATRTAQRLTPSRIWGSAFASPVDFLRNAHRGQRAPGLEIDIEAADATRDLFPTNQDAMSKRGYTADSFVGTFLDSELVRGTQFRSYRQNPVIVARVPGHYCTPEAMVWQDVSSGSYIGQSPSPTIAWVDLSEATTWEGPLEANDRGNFIGQSVQTQVQAAIRAARGEPFESGYESQFRKTLGCMYRALGSRVVEAVCDELGSLGIGDEILAQVFKFLVDTNDSASADLRLVTIAQFLRSQSALTRDAAATALDALDDRRAAAYLREAAVSETHAMLKCEFLEIAAELETE